MIVGRFFFINTFYTSTTILECNVKIKQTSDYHAAQKSPEYMEGLFHGCFTALLIMGGGGGVSITFLLRVPCVSLIVAILNFR